MPTRIPGLRHKGHLVTTSDGWTEYATDTAVEQHGRRKGMRVRTDQLDEPGKDDLPRYVLPPDFDRVSPRTDTATKTRQQYAADGTGVPLDSSGDKMF